MSTINKELLSDIGLCEDDDEIYLDEVEEEQEEIQKKDIDEKEQVRLDQMNEKAKKNSSSFDNEENKFHKMKVSLKNKNLTEKEKEKMKQKVDDFNKKQQQKGVCYLSRIPPYMKATFIRKLLESYGIERVYLAAEAFKFRLKKRKMRIKTGGNKRRCYTEGWVEFTDKRVAKRVALSLNCTKMVQKTRSFYGEDLWNIKYLPKFKWDNLTERINYQNRVRKDKLQQELQISKKEQDFYTQQLDQSKKIKAVEKESRINAKKG